MIRYAAEPSGFGDGWMVVQYPVDAPVVYLPTQDAAEQAANERNNGNG